jgi:hypothetical protein
MSVSEQSSVNENSRHFEGRLSIKKYQLKTTLDCNFSERIELRVTYVFLIGQK